MLKPRWQRRLMLVGLVVLLSALSSLALVPARAAGKTKPSEAQASSGKEEKPAKAEAKSAAQPAKSKDASSDSKKDSKKQETPKANKSAAPAAGKKPADKKLRVARIRIKGEYPEGPASPGLFGAMQTSLSTILEKLDQASEDDQVAAVILAIDDLSLGRGKLNELRAAISRLRKAGKPVYAELDSVDSAQYLLASACDEIVVSPQASLILPGVRAEAVFFKDLLDKLGIRMQVLQVGKYKSAAEPFTERKMSAAARENLEAIVDDSYDSLIADIAKTRQLDKARVKELIDQGFFTAKGAKEAELVDQVLYHDELVTRLEKKLKVDHLEVVDGYKKRKLDTDMSGMGGLMKLMEMVMGNKPEKTATKGRKIAVIYAVGMITSGEGSEGVMGDSVMGAKTIIEALQKAAKDDDVLAVVLRVDSPGGSAVASDLIWREVVQLKKKKPIIASMGDVAGSGGYYISMGASKIMAEPLSITGSIGVIGGKPVVSELLDKLGIHTEVISRGKNAGSMSLVDPFSQEERKAWMRLMRETYQQFVAKAAEGRKMPREEVEELAQGRVYTGRMAVDNGLVDQLGTLHDAIVEAKKAAGLKADEKVDLLILPEPKTFFERLFADPSAMENASIASSLFGGMLNKTFLVQRLLAEPSLVLMPQWVKLK